MVFISLLFNLFVYFCFIKKCKKQRTLYEKLNKKQKNEEMLAVLTFMHNLK